MGEIFSPEEGSDHFEALGMPGVGEVELGLMGSPDVR